MQNEINGYVVDTKPVSSPVTGTQVALGVLATAAVIGGGVMLFREGKKRLDYGRALKSLGLEAQAQQSARAQEAQAIELGHVVAASIQEANAAAEEAKAEAQAKIEASEKAARQADEIDLLKGQVKGLRAALSSLTEMAAAAANQASATKANKA